MNIIRKAANGKETNLSITLNQLAETSGKQLGERNLPVTLNEYKGHFFNVLQTKMQEYVDEVEHDKIPLSTQIIANEIQQSKKEKVHSIQSDLFSNESKRLNIQNELNDCPFNIWDRYKRILVVLVILFISTTESFLIYQAMRYCSLGVVASICLAIGGAIGLYYGTEAHVRLIRKANSVKRKIVTAVIGIIIMAIVFFGLASLRSVGMYNDALIDSALNDTKMAIEKVSPFLLAIFSTFMYSIALMVSYFFGMIPEEKEAFKEYLKKRRELSKLEKDTKRLQKEKQALEVKAFTVSAEAIKVYEDASITESVLLRMAESAQALFSKTNLMYRRDGLCPEFLSNPPKLELTFFKNKIHKYHEKELQ